MALKEQNNDSRCFKWVLWGAQDQNYATAYDKKKSICPIFFLGCFENISWLHSSDFS
jgi:hypothetical protein